MNQVIRERAAEKARLFNLVVLQWYIAVIRGLVTFTNVVKIRFQGGNKKLAADEKIAFLIWSIPAVLTCPGATVECMRNCYARRDERFLSVRISRIINYLISKRPDFETILESAINAAIYTKKGDLRKRYQGKEIVFRLHESGDFYSDRYMLAWFHVAAKFPEITFFTYTKSFRMYERNIAAKPNNFEVRASIWSDTTIEEIKTIARCGMSIYLYGIRCKRCTECNKQRCYTLHMRKLHKMRMRLCKT